MKVAIYCRVSKDEQNPEIQEKTLRKYAEAYNYEIYKVYTDVASGKRDSRPALNQLMFDCREKKFDSVVIWKLDRLGRSLKHLLNIAEEWHKLGIGFICTSQNIDTISPSGKLVYAILGAIAEFERELISERTKLGQKYAVNVGKRGKDKKKRRTSGYTMRWVNESKKMGG